MSMSKEARSNGNKSFFKPSLSSECVLYMFEFCEFSHTYAVKTFCIVSALSLSSLCSLHLVIISYHFHRMQHRWFLPLIMWFLFGEASSSSGCLGWATLFEPRYEKTGFLQK